MYMGPRQLLDWRLKNKLFEDSTFHVKPPSPTEDKMAMI